MYFFCYLCYFNHLVSLCCDAITTTAITNKKVLSGGKVVGAVSLFSRAELDEGMMGYVEMYDVVY